MLTIARVMIQDNPMLILVLRDRDIIEQGTHEKLLAKGGFYTALYDIQFEKASCPCFWPDFRDRKATATGD